jgi:hypothetical protein
VSWRSGLIVLLGRVTPLVAAVVTGCSDTAGVPALSTSLEVRTDRTAYSELASGGIAGPLVTVRNAGTTSVYVGQCAVSGDIAGLRTEREDAGGWVDTGGPEGICAVEAAATVLELHPGDRLSARILFPQPGHFRFRVPFGLRAAALADSVARSNGFTVQ